MKDKSRGPSQRQLRVGEQLRHIISETMVRGHFHNETLLNAKSITVSEVRVTPDLKLATAYVMTLGGHDVESIIPALNEETEEFQTEINRQTNLKFTPRVRFKKDESFDEAQRIEEVLKEIHKS